MDLNKRYIIDLSHAQSPADIVFELSSIIEKDEASNKKIWLKLGNITLNQSQLLSINSLINSINSTLSLIESESQQTELAAATLGISTKDVEEELQEEIQQMESDAEKAVEDTPSEQYIPMTDHIDQEDSEEENTTKENEVIENEQMESSNTEKEEILEQNETSEQQKNESIEENKNQELENTNNNVSTEPEEQEGNEEETAQNQEEIQNSLDSIFDSEAKLENILNEDKEINEMKNWPLTKEVGEFEIPEEEMTDEDYEILQMNTQYHKQTVRSGQVIKSNGNVVIIGDCHPGCEIHAAGDITVWGILGGIAHAGCNGNTKARIRALNLNAIQLRIADSYARRPDHIKNIYVEKSNNFTPEEARNINGSIVILKINDK